MLFSRRAILAVVGGAVATRAYAQADSRLTERSFGKPDAPVTVHEYFSLTCTHCAAFSRETMPLVAANLITPGKLRFVYHDFPLDQVALSAAMVARTLPPERYEPFVTALFASQDRWAFSRTANPTEELAKMAMLAGMSRATFEATLADNALRTAILTAQKQAEDRYQINSTPSFVIGDRLQAGEMNYAAFMQFVGVTG